MKLPSFLLSCFSTQVEPLPKPIVPQPRPVSPTQVHIALKIESKAKEQLINQPVQIGKRHRRLDTYEIASLRNALNLDKKNE